MSDRPCPFCAVTTETRELVESRQLVHVVLSNPRLVEGHLLVIPKRHVEDPFDLLDTEGAEMLETAVRYGARIKKVGLAPGYDLRLNHRPFLPPGRLKVNHVHMHVLPRWEPERDALYMASMQHERGLFEDLLPTRCKYLVELYRSAWE